MSGSTIGGVIGGAIGWFVGGPVGAQWGWMIGSTVGAIVDPEQIEGPRLGEAKTQTASDGVPLIYGYGTFPCAGNVAWVDEVKEHRNEESAKGGPEQITYTYTISYMVVVCKGEISGYKLIRRNGKIVYDARTDAELTALGYTSQEISETRAAQANFLQRATLYYGTDTQMPDPTMVAVKGAGNVPAYTGIAYIVMKDDETREGEYAQFEFVVANCGERQEDFSSPGRILITGDEISAGQPMFATAQATAEPEFVGINQSTGANVANGIPAYFNGHWCVAAQSGARFSTYALDDFQSGSLPFESGFPTNLVGGGYGWMVSRSNGFEAAKAPLGGGDFEEYEYSITRPGVDAPNGGGISMARYIGGDYYGDSKAYSDFVLCESSDLGDKWDLTYRRGDDTGGDIASIFYDIETVGGEWYAITHYGLSSRRVDIRRSSDKTSWTELLLSVDPDSGGNVLHVPYQLKEGGGVLVALCWGGAYFRTSLDGFASLHATGIQWDIQSFMIDETTGRLIEYVYPHFYLVSGKNNGSPSLGDKCVVVTIDETGVYVGDPISLPIQDVRGIAAATEQAQPGMVPIPDSPGFFIDQNTGSIIGPPGVQIDPCQPTLGEIVAGQCDRRSVTSRDVSELTDLVGGYRIAKPSSSQANIQGLQPGFFFGASEFDGVLHFPKRGRDLTFALAHDDFVERDGDPIQWERTQERDMLRKVTVAYVDPATTYTPTTQQAERRARTIAADGESTIELPVTGSKDWAAQVADKSLKAAWGEPDEFTAHVSIARADLVVGAEGTVPYTDGQPTVVHIEKIEDEGLVRMITGRITRNDLYESNASGAAKPLPRFPGSNIRGPTDGLLLNIPVLVDQDDRPGIYWAAARQMSGWQGAQLQIRRAGQWVNVGETIWSAGTGRLLAPLPAHSGDLDTVNILNVSMNEDLESVTYVNLLQERNPLAILRDDGTAEIVQFQTATQTSDGNYELTSLLRGRLATTPDGHAAGARVVVLDERVNYATLEPTDVGQTLEYRFVSLGTDPDAAPIQTMELTTMESQTEWPVDWLQVEQDGDDYTLTWLARDRLGSDVFPVRSANWVGYEVSYDHAGGSGSVVVTTETHTFTLPGASDIMFSVAQLNQYTGAGPAQTVTIQ